MYCQKCNNYIPTGLDLTHCPTCSADFANFSPRERRIAVLERAEQSIVETPRPKQKKGNSRRLFFVFFWVAGPLFLGFSSLVAYYYFNPDPETAVTASGQERVTNGDIPWSEFQAQPNLESAKHDIQIILQWLIKSDFPGSKANLKDYLAAIETMGAMPSPFMFTKTQSTEGVRVFVDPSAFAELLKTTVEKRNSVLFHYGVTRCLVQEAWGYHFYKSEKAKQQLVAVQKIQNSMPTDPAMYTDLLKFLLQPWGNQSLVKSFFETQGDDIVRRAALYFAMEYYELLETREFDRWAIKKGILSEEGLRQLLPPAALKTAPEKFLVEGLNENELIQFGLSQLVSINLISFVQGRIHDESFTYGIYGGYEIWRFVNSGGSEGLDPKIMRNVSNAGLPMPEFFKDISPRFKEYLLQNVEGA